MTPTLWLLAYVLYAVVQGIFTARVMAQRSERVRAAFACMLLAPLVSIGLLIAAFIGFVAWATDDL